MLTLEHRMTELELEVRRLKGGQRRLGDTVMALKHTVDDTQKLIVENNQMTSEIRELVTNLKGFGATVRWAGKALKTVGMYVILPFVFVSGLMYAILHHGKFPEWWVSFIEFFFG